MVCSPPGSSIDGYSPGKNTGVGLPFPSPGGLPDPGIKLESPALQEDSLLSEPPGKPSGSVGKESACSAGDTGDVGSAPESGSSPGEGSGNPLQCSCLENPHGQLSLVGCSPRGHTEWDTAGETEPSKLFKVVRCQGEKMRHC